MQINGIQFNVELETIIEDVKSQLALNGIALLQKTRDSGDDIMVQCPYHAQGQERRPSAGIRKSDGQFHCFSCGEVHTLPEVIEYCFGHDSSMGSWGWKWLLKNYATVEVEERKDVVLDLERNFRGAGSITSFSGSIGDSDGCVHHVGEKELEKYRYTHPYMYKRRLTDDIIELFDIGYDKETKCITFPIRDIDGNCLFIARRSVKTKFFSYPKGVEKPLYGLYELSRLEQFPNEVIVCESMLDALTAWVYGRYAVALNGLGNELQFDQLRKLPCRILILATDNDQAGMKARKRIRENIHSAKLIKEYILPDGRKDLNELSKEEFVNLMPVF